MFIRYNFRWRKCRMWLGNPNTISIIGDSETMCRKAVIIAHHFLCNTYSYTVYTFHVLCNILTVSVMNPDHVNYLHYALYCYNCVGFPQ
jgi:hypothetical protein